MEAHRDRLVVSMSNADISFSEESPRELGELYINTFQINMDIISISRAKNHQINSYRHKPFVAKCDEKIMKQCITLILLTVNKCSLGIKVTSSPIARHKCLTDLFGSCSQCSQQDKCMCTH